MRVTVTVAFYSHFVYAAFYVLGDVEFVRSHRALRITYKASVDIYFNSRFCGAEVQKYFFSVEVLRQGKGASVKTDFLHIVVNAGDFALLTAYGSRESARIVIRSAARALCLPNRRNGYVAPFGVVKIRLVEIRRTVVDAHLPVKFPLAV